MRIIQSVYSEKSQEYESVIIDLQKQLIDRNEQVLKPHR